MRVGCSNRTNKLLIESDSDPRITKQLKELIGWTQGESTGSCSCQFNPFNTKKLVEMGAEFDEQTKKEVRRRIISARNRRAKIRSINSITGLLGTLRPFQWEGVHFIEEKRGRAVIGDEMGLGKTIQSLAWLQLHPEARPAVVLCPSSIKLNWEREAIEWMDGVRTTVLQGQKPNPIKPEEFDIIIINYRVVSYWLPTLIKLQPKVLVVDECHYLKNRKAARTKAFRKLVKVVPHVIALSGTPIVNRPEEFFVVLNAMNPTTFPSWLHYVQRYCDASYGRFGLDTSGSSNVQELHQILRSEIMIRRTKDEVLKELPPKSRAVVPVTMDNRQEYQRCQDDFRKWWKASGGSSAAITLVRVQKLREIAVRGKMKAVVEWIEDFLTSDQKIVVFAWHTFVLDILEEAFKGRSVRVDGSANNQQKQDRVDQFQQSDKIRVFLGNFKAAGVGITLTASTNVVFVELPWSPGTLVQAEDRCHRIGQRGSVTVWYLVAQGTIETHMRTLLEEKAEVMGKVLDGKAVQLGILWDLVKRITNTER